jgi:hypothetical protein
MFLQHMLMETAVNEAHRTSGRYKDTAVVIGLFLTQTLIIDEYMYCGEAVMQVHSLPPLSPVNSPYSKRARWTWAGTASE